MEKRKITVNIYVYSKRDKALDLVACVVFIAGSILVLKNPIEACRKYRKRQKYMNCLLKEPLN